MGLRQPSAYHLARSMTRAVQILSLIVGGGMMALGIFGIFAGLGSPRSYDRGPAIMLGFQALFSGALVGSFVYVLCAAIQALFDIADLMQLREARESIKERPRIPKPTPLVGGGAYEAPTVPAQSESKDRRVLTEADIERMERERKK